ncbi:MAG: SUMF1/EgtB/PvdO family nonheme iron enzyme [Pedobacter sp.]|jgi:gliding motility-associated lipoprotein GldJ|uniref:SUMF1/EgtB/PvdO family nonheme iron enzyme n=1 Tax=Pedobacter sp. TaxID=1411316 RepID=UPI003569E5D9
MKKTYLQLFIFLVSITIFTSCNKNAKTGVSSKTGYAYNKKENGGFEVASKYKRGPAGTGLVEIEGGVFIMGGSAVDIPGQDLSNYNYKREVSVSSFYMDETEVSNTNWLEYLNWIKRSYPTDAQYYYEELPDTLVWRRPLSFNEPYVNNYLRHPAYQNYPVVGVSALQAERYCAWRTDMVNEKLLRDKGFMTSFAAVNGTATGRNAAATPAAARPTTPFNTEIYLNGQYDDKGPKAKADLNPAATANGAAATTGRGAPTATRNVRLEDGVILQPFRLPSELEWEYAALGLIGNTQYENIGEKKIYPWNGLGITSAKKSTRGLILANFKRGKGDYMGVGGSLNDKAAFTQDVKSYEPNDFGLYNMAGNVNEWTRDIYRASTFEQADALNAFRGNQYQNKDRDPITGKLKQDKYGKPEMVNANSGVKQTWAELQAGKAAGNTGTTAYNPDQRGYRDEESSLYGVTTLVNNKSRVYKGGSWDDQAQWLNPAARRYLQEDESTADIGFRCAMTMLGSSEIKSVGKPQFKVKGNR